MNMRRIGSLVVALSIGLLAGWISTATLTAAVPPVQETVLLRVDLAGVPGKELIVSRLEAAPGWTHGRHYHAGHELVYVLEGSGLAEIEGKSPTALTPGAVFHAPPGQIHAGRNASDTALFKFLLVRIHEKGQPLSVELGS